MVAPHSQISFYVVDASISQEAEHAYSSKLYQQRWTSSFTAAGTNPQAQAIYKRTITKTMMASF